MNSGPWQAGFRFNSIPCSHGPSFAKNLPVAGWLDQCWRWRETFHKPGSGSCGSRHNWYGPSHGWWQPEIRVQLNQLRLVVYPIIYMVLAPSQGTINSKNNLFLTNKKHCKHGKSIQTGIRQSFVPFQYHLTKKVEVKLPQHQQTGHQELVVHRLVVVVSNFYRFFNPPFSPLASNFFP